MSDIEVKRIIEPTISSDGAGVKLKRSIGLDPDYFDPFLMLDEFGSDSKEDYIGGFPAHPHRGIETVTYMLQAEIEHEDFEKAQQDAQRGSALKGKRGRMR